MLINHEVAAPRLRPCRGTVAFILTKTSTEAKRVCRTSVWLQRAVVEGEIEPGVAAAACVEGTVSKLGGRLRCRPIEFDRHAAARRRSRGLGKPETFAFLGFTFICGTARRGGFQVQRKSRRDPGIPRLRPPASIQRHIPLCPKSSRAYDNIVCQLLLYLKVPAAISGRPCTPSRKVRRGERIRHRRRRARPGGALPGPRPPRGGAPRPRRGPCRSRPGRRRPGRPRL